MAKKTHSIKEAIEGKNPFVRDTWADYADKRLIPKHNVCRFDDKLEHRFYYFMHEDELIIASGVTDPLGIVSTEREAINQWKENNPNWRHLLNISSEYGSLEHLLFGEIALNKKVNKTLLTSMHKIATENNKSQDMPVKDALAFLKFREDVKLRPLLIEGQIVYQDCETGEWLAMTVDMVAEMDIIEKEKEMVEDGVWQRGEKKGQPKIIEIKKDITKTLIVVIDFKSNFFEKDKKKFYESHRMQLMAAQLAVEQNFDLKVDRLYNFACNNWRVSPSYTLYEHKITDKNWRKFWAYWNLIIADELNKPSGTFIIADTPRDSNDYKMLSYKEYVEQVLLKPAKEENTYRIS